MKKRAVGSCRDRRDRRAAGVLRPDRSYSGGMRAGRRTESRSQPVDFVLLRLCFKLKWTVSQR